MLPDASLPPCAFVTLELYEVAKEARFQIVVFLLKKSTLLKQPRVHDTPFAKYESWLYVIQSKRNDQHAWDEIMQRLKKKSISFIMDKNCFWYRALQRYIAGKWLTNIRSYTRQWQFFQMQLNMYCRFIRGYIGSLNKLQLAFEERTPWKHSQSQSIIFRYANFSGGVECILKW